MSATTGLIVFVALAMASVQCAPQQHREIISLDMTHITGCPQGSKCVPYYLCRNSTIVKDGSDIIDIRYDEDECLSYLEVCCNSEHAVAKPLIDTSVQKSDGCGFRNVAGIGFKITGDKDNETQYGEFPWMVAVLKEENAGNQILKVYQCGGSLIHPRVVLTSAHRIPANTETTLKARAGEWDTQTLNEPFEHQDRDVIEVVVHENYDKTSLHNDIALLFLSAPFEIGNNINTVCLPPPNSNFDYRRCFATGWGKDSFEQIGTYQVILKKIDLPIVSNDACQASLRTTRLGKHFELHRSFICAGGETGKDTCKGDGGSPLVCPIPGKHERYYQAGIVAWGIGCGDEIPAVYANVPELRSWLDTQLAYKQIDSKYYTP